MPGFDRSGPMGVGPMTGGRKGICGRTDAAASYPVYGGGYGRGMGFRRGNGRGRGYGFSGYPYPQAYATGTRYPGNNPDEMEMLRADADVMRQSLEAIQRRITELEKEASE